MGWGGGEYAEANREICVCATVDAAVTAAAAPKYKIIYQKEYATEVYAYIVYATEIVCTHKRGSEPAGRGL